MVVQVAKRRDYGLKHLSRLLRLQRPLWEHIGHAVIRSFAYRVEKLISVQLSATALWYTKQSGVRKLRRQ